MVMAQRLSKALRDKRRWIGLSVSPAISKRDELKEILSKIAPVGNWKLYDFKESKAILRILLKDQSEWRKVLSDESNQVHSITMSGKIRLVRERLGL